MTPERLDSFLIDKAFQPIADRLARWISCYGIAAFLLTGVTLGNAVAFAWTMRWEELLVTAWFAYRCRDAYVLDRAPPSNALPVERIKRSGWMGRPGLVLCVAFFTTIHIVAPAPGWSRIDIWAYRLWWIYIAAAYFMACRRDPPKPKAAKIPRGLAYGGASP